MEILDKIKQEGNFKKFNYKGLDCEIFRNELGILCGYLTIPKFSKLYQMNMNELPVNPHGGITYHSQDNSGLKIGFDCGHAGDLIPYIGNFEKNMYRIYAYGNKINTYRNMEYVEQELYTMVNDILNADKSIKEHIRDNTIEAILN
jgi:hypothetical protein